MGRRRNGIALLAAAALVGGSTTACAGWGGGVSSGGKDSINVLMVNNPQMMDLQKLAPEFEKRTGITVEIEMYEASETASKVMLDLKFFDVPETVKLAVRQVRDRGVSFATIHGNDPIIRAAVAEKGDLNILAVTVLTSFDESDLRAVAARVRAAVG